MTQAGSVHTSWHTALGAQRSRYLVVRYPHLLHRCHSWRSRIEDFNAHDMKPREPGRSAAGWTRRPGRGVWPSDDVFGPSRSAQSSTKPGCEPPADQAGGRELAKLVSPPPGNSGICRSERARTAVCVAWDVSCMGCASESSPRPPLPATTLNISRWFRVKRPLYGSSPRRKSTSLKPRAHASSMIAPSRTVVTVSAPSGDR